MLRTIKNLVGYPVEATDGEMGKVKDFLFDDQNWVMRYVVVETGGWLSSRKVLVATRSLGVPDLGSVGNHFPVNLTKEEVKNSPSLDEDAPISRRYEQEFAEYYSHEPYWQANVVWGAPPPPPPMPHTPEELQRHDEHLAEIAKCHLRSAHEVTGYAVSATDGQIGHVEDFVVETKPWTVRWMVIDTTNWLPGGKVLISTAWVEGFDWHRGVAEVNLTKEQIEKSPDFDAHAPVNRAYETQLFDFYGRPYYWG